MSQVDGSRERLVRIYRARAKNYHFTSLFAPAPGYPRGALRRRAIAALGLKPGDRVVDLACGTGPNFALIERRIGRDGVLTGVDFTDAMLARAKRRARAHGWRNVELVHGDAAEIALPDRVDAIVATYPHALGPHPERVLAHGARSLADRGRWVVLDLKIPDGTPRWAIRLTSAVLGRSASLQTWAAKRPWERLHDAMRHTLADVTWTDLCWGTAYLASGSKLAGQS